MNALDMMTPAPACCIPRTPLREVARMMANHHCGAIPVLNSLEMRIPVGMITDRDIACRTVAKGLDPLSMTAAECMSTPVATVFPESSLEQCMLNMMDADVRRIVVVSHKGVCLGIISVADLAHHATDHQMGELIRAISRFDYQPSHITTLM